MVSNVKEVKARGAVVLTITKDGAPDIVRKSTI
jgi:glucosamine 6-phosphate synthetase-like amidotransferase/phosphosugar isomerase protein